MSENLPVALTGPTPRPEGEEGARHTGSAGEESRAPLANESRGSSSGSTTQAATGRLLDIVRASSRIRLDLADLAVDRAEHIKRRCGGVEAGCPACLARRDLGQTQRLVAAALNAATRLCWRVDADTYDACMLKEGRAPKGAEWKPNPERMLTVLRSVVPGANGAAKLVAEQLVNTNGNLYTYPLVRLVAPGLSSNICATLARNAERKWQQERFDALVRQIRRPPHYLTTVPIPIPAAAVSVTAGPDDTYIFSFSLVAGAHNKGKKQFNWPLKAHDAHIRNILQGLVAGTIRMGEVKLDQDRRRPGRWYVRFSYTRQIQIGPERRAHVVGVNRGINCFLAAVGSDGDRWLYDGKDIVAYLKQTQRRRREYQRDSKASSRWGHGRTRTLKPIFVLQGKAERWRQTKCQTIARQFALWVQKNGYTQVYLEDFSGIRDALPEKLEGGKRVWDMVQEWPYYQLGQKMVSCLEEIGVGVTVVSPEGISQICPVCGARSAEHIDLRHRKFKCLSCGHKEHLDTAAARNTLARGASGDTLEARQAANAAGKAGPGSGKKGGARKPPRKTPRSNGNGKTGGNGS